MEGHIYIYVVVPWALASVWKRASPAHALVRLSSCCLLLLLLGECVTAYIITSIIIIIIIIETS